MTTDATVRESALQDALIKIASESWRLLRSVQRVQEVLDADQQRRLLARMSFFDRTLNDELKRVGLRLVDFSGQPFGPQLPASAINGDEFPDATSLIVDQTVEPAVLGPNGVIKTGVVTLRRGIS